jgi:hypothetical protein
MKKTIVSMMTFLLAGAMTFAATPAKSAKPASKTKKVEVVSADATAKTLAYKTTEGGEVSADVQGKTATAALTSLKAGDKVTVAYHEDKDTQKTVVTSIHKSTSTGTKHKTKTSSSTSTK